MKKWVIDSHYVNDNHIWIENSDDDIMLEVLGSFRGHEAKRKFAQEIADKLNNEESK